MSERKQGHSALAHYSCDLPGFRFDETEWPAQAGVKRATIAANGKTLRVVVTTELVASERRAEHVAGEIAEDIWWALQQGLTVNVESATRVVRDSISYTFIDGSGSVAVSVALTARASISATDTLTPGPATLAAAARHQRPPPSHAADLYRDAVAERDPVLQFTGLYNAVVAAVDLALKCECQVCTDELLLRLAPGTTLVPCASRKEMQARAGKGHVKDLRLADHATVFTSLRNRLDHAHSAARRAQGGWAATKEEVRQVVSELRTIAVRALHGSSAQPPRKK